MSTNISWTDETWSPVTGCTRVSDGCLNCYIERTPPMRMSGRRFDLPIVGGMTGVQLHPERLDKPLHWRKPRKVFVCSMADLFHEQVPDEHIAKVFATMAATPQHTYQVLTKRPARMRAVLVRPGFAEQVLDWGRAAMRAKDSRPRVIDQAWPLPNVWCGTSVESQHWANIRIPTLLRVPAAVRFLSCEPLLGPIDLSRWVKTVDWPPCFDEHPSWTECSRCINPDWVIVGGESGPPANGGPGVRPMHPDWARSLRDQCRAAGVPLHFKQWGDWAPIGPLYGDTDEVQDAHMEAVHLEVDQRRAVIQLEPGGIVVNPEEHQPSAGTWLMANVGKKAAGRELDGRTWDEFPGVQADRAEDGR